MTLQLPMHRPHPLAAPPDLRRLHESGPVHRVRTAVGDEAWLVTGYDEVRSLLNDDRLGRSHPDPANAARASDSALFGGPQGDPETEDASHAWMRSYWRPHFTPKRMHAFRPRVQKLTEGLLGDLSAAGPPADLNEAVALPLPIMVICELLGVPYADREIFGAWSDDAIDMADRARSSAGIIALTDYTRTLAGRKRQDPGDDVISQMCGDGLTDDEVAMLAWALLFAGHETTVIEIGYGTVQLLSHPDQWRALRDDPTLAASTVEEVLRLGPINGGDMGLLRYTREQIEVGGAVIPAGELVLLDNGAANRDEGTFPDADRFDVTRLDAAHITFGHGKHFCAGAPLARMELETVFSALASSFPNLHLMAPVEELPLREGALTGGFAEIPVSW